MSQRKSRNYEVGYGKPPRDRRFKPGQSGNPRGRPKKRLSLLELFECELKRKRPIVEDGRRSRVQTDIVLVKRTVDLAVKGDLKALKMMLALTEQIREIASASDDRDIFDMSPEELAAYYAQLRDTIPGTTAVRLSKTKRSFS